MGNMRERDIGIDIVKTIAVFGVVLIHVSAVSFPADILSRGWALNLFWASVSRASVPLFLMCTGALFLGGDREVSAKKIWSKNMVRIIVSLFFWAFAYGLFRMAINGESVNGGIMTLLRNVAFFKHENHLYYLHMVILIYALLPIISVFFRNADKKLVMYALAVWYVTAVVYSTLRPFYPLSELSGIPVQWQLNSAYGAVGYVLLGAFLKKDPMKKSTAVLSLIAGFAVVYGITLFASRADGKLYSNFLEGMSIGVSLMAAGIYSLCANAVPKKFLRFFTALSKSSFCIYLTHMFAVIALGGAISRLNRIAFVSVPIIAAAVMCLSFCVYLVLSRIPIVKKWII